MHCSSWEICFSIKGANTKVLSLLLRPCLQSFQLPEALASWHADDLCEEIITRLHNSLECNDIPLVKHCGSFLGSKRTSQWGLWNKLHHGGLWRWLNSLLVRDPPIQNSCPDVKNPGPLRGPMWIRQLFSSPLREKNFKNCVTFDYIMI
jgi:hypothetical protein